MYSREESCPIWVGMVPVSCEVAKDLKIIFLETGKTRTKTNKRERKQFKKGRKPADLSWNR